MIFRMCFRDLRFVAVCAILFIPSLRAADDDNKVPENRAVLIVHLPEDAALEIQGIEIPVTGPVRRLRTASLDPAKAYTYSLRASWKDRDEWKVVHREVQVRAGEQFTVRIEEAAATPKEVAKDPRQEPGVCALGRFLIMLQKLEPILGPLEYLSVSSDQRYAITKTGGDPPRLWDVTSAIEIRQFAISKSDWFYFNPSFSPDGRRLVYQNGEFVVVLDLRTGKDITKFTSKNPSSCATFSPDGKRLAIGHQHGEIVLYDLETLKPVFRKTLAELKIHGFEGYGSGPNLMVFTSDGKSIVSSLTSLESKPRIIVWDASTGQIRHEIQCEKPDFIAVSPDNKRAICRCFMGFVFGLDLEAGKETPITDLQDSRAVVDALQKALPKSQGLVACELGRFYVELKRLEWMIGPFSCIWLSPPGRFMVTDHGRIKPPTSGNAEQKPKESFARIWDVKERREVTRLKGFFNRSNPVFSHDGHRLAYHTEDGSLHIIDAQAGSELRCLERKKANYEYSCASAFSSDGSKLVWFGNVIGDFGKDRGWFEIWDLDTGKRVQTHKGELSVVTSVAFGPEKGQVVVSGVKTIQVCDLATGKTIRSFNGHVGIVYGVMLAPDGSRMLSGSSDGTVRLWNMKTGTELHEKEWHTPWAKSILESSSGQRFLTTGVREVPGPHNTPVGSSSGGGPTIIVIPQ